MRNIKFLVNVENYKAGEVFYVENNVAHRYIDRGQAELVTATTYNDTALPSVQTKVIKK